LFIDYGRMVVVDGALLQLGQLMGYGYFGLLFYGLFKTCEHVLVHGLAGEPPQDLATRQSRALVGRMPMARVGRARERSETFGFMQIMVDAETKRIWGRRRWAPKATRRYTVSWTSWPQAHRTLYCSGRCTSTPPSPSCSRRCLAISSR
jgi:endonuclease III